ncbi:MAG: hypothetical protein DIU54_015125 [Acidobacteriota bacterium]|jgi:hypothetical protein|nr:MAG: hypothetical protein DIU54_11650 [Acidobacteriota bacterium]
MSRLHPGFLAVVLTAALALSGVTTSSAQQPAARYSAVAVDMLSPGAGAGTFPVNIVINRWSTQEEEDRLVAILLEQGPDALLTAMQKWPPVGSVAPTGGVGFDIRFAVLTHRDNGLDEVMALTDRPMSFLERRAAGRSTDYPFTLIQMQTKPSGDGEGQISIAARLRIDKVNRTLVIDNFTDQPIMLRGLKREQ